MVVRTTMLEVTLPPKLMKDPVKQEALKRDLKACFVPLNLTSMDFPLSGPRSDLCMRLCFTGDNNNFAVVQTNCEGLLTIDITENVPDGGIIFITQELIDDLIANLKKSTGGLTPKYLPTIQRGQPFQVYFPSVDNLFIEFDFDQCVFEADTPYQNVKIMHSNQYGNVLLTDDHPYIAESDLLYTQTITGHDQENYTGKRVLILGGGHGGILHKVLQENPAFVTMIDIDAVVVEAAAKHLRGICYDSLDKLSGDNYKVMIADCAPILERYSKEGKVFDVIINDVTAVPRTTEPTGKHWDFLFHILKLSMQVLSPTGKYYAQGNGYNLQAPMAIYEAQLKNLSTPVDFKTHVVYVPSYHEMWVFYEIWKKASQVQ